MRSIRLRDAIIILNHEYFQIGRHAAGTLDSGIKKDSRYRGSNRRESNPQIAIKSSTIFHRARQYKTDFKIIIRIKVIIMFYITP